MVAAPLWAFFHIRPDGQEFIEQVQRPGYMIMFNLFLRIPLAIFGLLFSFLMIDVMMWFEGVTFIPAFLGATSNNGYGIFGIITAFIMLGYLHWQICIRSFSLITHLPDNVTRWFGQSGENHLGENHHAMAAVGAVTSHVEKKANVMGEGGMVGTAMKQAKGKPPSEEPASTTPSNGGGGGGNSPPANSPSSSTAAAAQTASERPSTGNTTV